MSDAVKFLPDIQRWEGVIPWLYRDVLGYATIGIGFLVRDIDEALELPLTNFTENRPATCDEISREFNRVMGCRAGQMSGAYRATRPPRLEMRPEAVKERALKRLETEFLPGIRGMLPGFDAFPEPAQSCIVDMAWNLGIGHSATDDRKANGLHGFPSFLAACNHGNWAEAAQHCHVSTSRQERNAWRVERLLAARTA